MAARLKHKASKFEVRTPSAVCAVRGTDFTIDLASAAAEIGLFEGQLAGSEAVVSGPGAEAAVSAHFSGLMQAEQRRYLKLKKRAEDLRRKLETRENFIDDFVRIQQQKLQDFDNRRREKLNKRK